MSLEHLGVNETLLPAGGGGQWYYDQEWDGGTFRMEEMTTKELVRSVTNFRINQHMPMGDVEKDIADYILARCPANRLFGQPHALVGPAGKSRPITPLVERLRDWLARDRTRPKRLVNEDEARKRAYICQGCPQNIVNWESNCVVCNDQVKHEGMMMRQKTHSIVDEDLGGCRLYAMYLPAAVYLDRDELPERNEKCPSNCWVKKE